MVALDPSLPAYEAILKAFHYRFSKADFARSLACLEQATELDPEFAFAHSALGEHFLTMFTVQVMPAHDAAPLARRHAQRALEIDPALSEAHSVLGCVAALYNYGLAVAQGTPSHSARVHRVNFFLAHAGRGHEAVREMEQVVREDPLDWGSKWALAVAYRSVGRDAEADTQYRAASRRRSDIGHSGRRSERQPPGPRPEAGGACLRRNGVCA